MQEIPQTKSDVISYSKSSTIQPSYQFLPIFQETGTQTMTINTTAGQYSLFEIPVEVVNLSRTELCFTVTPGASGAGNYNRQYLNTIPYFTQVQLLSRKGQEMVSINNADRVNAIMKRACVSLEEMLESDVTKGALSRVNAAGTNLRLDGSTCDIAYTEMKYTQIGGSNTATPVIKFKIPLKELGIDSLLEMDKDLYFGEIVRLRLTWNTREKTGFYGTAAANNATGAAAYAQDVAISNLVLRLALQRDEKIVEHVRGKFSSGGISMLIPFITSYARSLNAAVQTVDLKLDANHGHSLLRVYHSVFSPSGTAAKEYQSDCGADAIITSYYTSLDRKKMQQFDLDVSEGDDYQYNRAILEGSTLQSQNVYQYNWFHCDDFSGFKSVEDRKAYLQNVACGLPLSSEKTWSFYGNCVAANTDHLTVVVTQKVLNITPSGISVV